MEFWQTVPTVLNYGAIGFALLLAFLCYRLLKTEQQSQRPPKAMLRYILCFMGLSLLMSLGAGAIEIFKHTVGVDPPGWGSIQGDLSSSSFIDGGEGSRLDGAWKVKWMVVDGNKEVPYKVPLKNGNVIDYPPEIIQLRSRGALLACNTTSSVNNVPYWLEGRISRKGIVTLIYWGPRGLLGQDLLGVVLLSVDDPFDGPVKMKGSWTGYTRDNKVTTGTVTWEKIE